MKNVVAYLIFLLEMAGIIAVCVILGNEYARHFATVVPIPDGMQLTFEKDFEVDTRDGALFIPEGTVIIPEEIFPDKVVIFSYEGYERLRAEGEYFKEKDQFEPLLAEAEHNHEEAVLKNKILYIAIGIAIAAGWLVIGGLLTKLSIKHEKEIIAVILHNRLEFVYGDGNGYIDSKDVINDVNPVCKINILDIQACYCAWPEAYPYKNSDDKTVNTTTCIAYELIKKSNVQKVYAWTDQVGFNSNPILKKLGLDLGQSVSIFGAYVEFYEKETGGIGVREVKSYRYFFWWPAYAPLQY